MLVAREKAKRISRHDVPLILPRGSSQGSSAFLVDVCSKPTTAFELKTYPERSMSQGDTSTEDQGKIFLIAYNMD